MQIDTTTTKYDMGQKLYMDFFGEMEAYIIGEIKINGQGVIKYGVKNEASPTAIYVYLTEAEIEKIFNAAEDTVWQVKGIEMFKHTVENKNDSECPCGGDIADDCADCFYSGEFHYINGECVRREEN